MMKQKLKRIWRRIYADKKRFSLFCSLVLIALLLWARIIVIARPPKTAIADQVASAALAPVQTSDNDPIPVILDNKPLKNPFVVSQFAYPIDGSSTDNQFAYQPNANDSINSTLMESYELDAVMGNLAMINGKVYQIGDVLPSGSTTTPLTITGVEGRTVIISTGNHRYELSIASFRR